MEASVWLYTFLSVFIISIISLIGVFTISMNEKRMHSLMFLLVSFAAGALLADAFLHIIPEAVETTGFTKDFALLVLLGIVAFFVLENVLNWRHCHHPTTKEHPHPYIVTNLVGDALHNFMDGIVIAVSFMANIPLGIATSVAVLLHEIPQEIGDFGVLVHGGITKGKALLLNFMISITALLGAGLALILGSTTEWFSQFLLPITAGGFIYIASADLIPQLHQEQRKHGSWRELFMFIMGILVMYGLLFLEI